MHIKQFEKLREAAKRLDNPTWIKRYANGDAEQAALRLSEKYGFSGRPNHLVHLCIILKDHPDYDDFGAAVESWIQQGREAMVDDFAHFEVTVGSALVAGSDPTKSYPGECYRRAWEYCTSYAADLAVLVHGTVRYNDQTRTGHAWVELPGDIVFDGVTQRFYDGQQYRDVRKAERCKEYQPSEARYIGFQNGNYGPW